jgi:allantoinase
MESNEPFAIYSARTLLPDKTIPATVFIENGKISAIHPGKKEEKQTRFFDVGNSVLMPGIIDPHVHINEPGRTQWEGFETATSAAAAGGITTLVDMPLNSNPVTINKNNFTKKHEASKNKCNVNVFFWGGAVPENSNSISDILATDVLGIKAFLTHSGIDHFANVTENDLNKIMPIISKSGKPLLVHCELDQTNKNNELLEQHPTHYQAWLKSRPKVWENRAIELMISLCEKHNCAIHIVHLSSAEALPMIRQAKEKGLPVTVETCPHYLYFNAENIPDANTLFKCAPPIREKANNDALFQALKNGLIDFVASDHSPATPDIKELTSGNLLKAWGGIAGLQFSLPLIWTIARKNNLAIENLKMWLCENPAKLIQKANKGKISEGYDADLVVWDPDQKFTITKNEIKFRHKISPYIGETVYGKVEKTFVAGKCIYNSKAI